jgi:hypothetical protein
MRHYPPRLIIVVWPLASTTRECTVGSRQHYSFATPSLLRTARAWPMLPIDSMSEVFSSIVNTASISVTGKMLATLSEAGVLFGGSHV